MLCESRPMAHQKGQSPGVDLRLYDSVGKVRTLATKAWHTDCVNVGVIRRRSLAIQVGQLGLCTGDPMRE
jgi:hypothetical protein